MQHRGPQRPPTERRAPGWAVLGAVLGVLLAGLVAIPGCLNPRPEEDPSALELADPAGGSAVSENGPAMEAADPIRESCDDNPLLSGCEPPSPTPGAGGVDAPPPASEGPPAAPADAGAPGPNDAGGVDAGAAAPAGSPLAD
jgi:hypothetical protein